MLFFCIFNVECGFRLHHGLQYGPLNNGKKTKKKTAYSWFICTNGKIEHSISQDIGNIYNFKNTLVEISPEWS